LPAGNAMSPQLMGERAEPAAVLFQRGAIQACRAGQPLMLGLQPREFCAQVVEFTTNVNRHEPGGHTLLCETARGVVQPNRR